MIYNTYFRLVPRELILVGVHASLFFCSFIELRGFKKRNTRIMFAKVMNVNLEFKPKSFSFPNVPKKSKQMQTSYFKSFLIYNFNQINHPN